MTSPPDDLAVEVRDLRIRRSGRDVLDGLSFDVPAGSLTGLVGPSGCGKTTLMRAIVGVQRISGGSIRVLSHRAGSPVLRRRVAYTSQSLSIYRDITVWANVAYFAGLLGLDVTAVDRAISIVGLDDVADTPVERLSGGQASRASLACALVGDPALLVLDEPTVGLDPLTRESLWRTFRGLADQGVCVLISSHVMDEAARCDSTILMREGRILAHEPLSSLIARTRTRGPEEAFIALVKESSREPLA